MTQPMVVEHAAPGTGSRSSQTPMRILIVSYFFPPFNAIGGVRVGKIAKYLTLAGHDVRVISAEDQPLQATLPTEIPEAHVIRTPWLNVNRLPELLLGGRKKVAARGYAPTMKSGLARKVLGRLGSAYKHLTNIPDGHIGWAPYSTRRGLQLIATWKPDIIYASGLPWTSLVIGSRLARRAGVPWVAELRDLWAENAYGDLLPGWRRRFDRWLERRVLRSASGFVSVSDPLARVLADKYHRPAEVILNGLDPEDYPPAARPAPGPVRIVYTGMIYEGRRDPSPLFRALRQMGPAAEGVRVSFYGRYLEGVRRLAAQAGVEHLIDVNDAVPYAEALRLQAEADVLLLLLWNDPREDGVCPGKVFEYFGARRPVLVLGSERNFAASLIRDRGAGDVLWEAGEIAARLTRWVEEKRRGGIPAVPEEASAGLTRREQTARLAEFLTRIRERV